MIDAKLARATRSGLDLVNLSAFKEHLRVEHGADDDLLRHLLKAAYDWVENYTGRALLTTNWQYTTTPMNQPGEVRQALPFPPAIDIESVHVLRPNGGKSSLRRFTTETLHGVTYVCFISQSLPVSITYSSGYGALPGDVPEEIHLAVKTLAAFWYENREGLGGGIPQMVLSLLAPYQIRKLI